ncbi:MAG: YeeE/YedE family protein [Dehalococcoidia bacterium]|nr:YeeE/YedE family protein [Dehalococcoidia bacterium]
MVAIAPAATRVRPPVREWLAPLLVVGGLVAVYLVAQASSASMAVFWAVGLAVGFVLQRARFCFTSAFRDLFLLGQGRTMRGILVGLIVATLGFAMVMATIIPNPSTGVMPTDAHILPLGPATVLGGVLFGFGMVIAGGCVSGALYRMGEGYVGSWVAMGGVMLGLYTLNRTWNWWWDHSISLDPFVWLPESLGYAVSIALTVLLLLAAYVGVLWWERRAAGNMPVIPIKRREPPPPASVGDDVRVVLRRIFRQEWTPLVGGVALALLNVLLFIRYRPLGVVGEISRWANDVGGSLGAGVGTLKGLDGIAGCAPVLTEGASWFTDAFMLNVGIVAGSFASATFAREFRLRVPRSPRRYVQSLGGGLIMGYGAGLGLGCTLGAFFSAVPSLALNGWVYAAALAGGAYLGVQVIRRFP